MSSKSCRAEAEQSRVTAKQEAGRVFTVDGGRACFFFHPEPVFLKVTRGILLPVCLQPRVPGFYYAASAASVSKNSEALLFCDPQAVCGILPLHFGLL